MTSGFISLQLSLAQYTKVPFRWSTFSSSFLPRVRVGVNALTANSFCLRYSSCDLISSIVDCLRSLKRGESCFAQSLHMFPSSSLRLPKRPIFSPQISHSFLSNNPIKLVPFNSKFCNVHA